MPGTRIPTLGELFALVRKAGNTRVRFNIETKIDPNHPDESLDPQGFVAKLLGLIEAEGFSDRVMIQSFDWRDPAARPAAGAHDSDGLPDAPARLGPDGGVGQGDELDGGFQPGRSRRLAAADDQGWGGAVWSPYFGDVTEAVV